MFYQLIKYDWFCETEENFLKCFVTKNFKNFTEPKSSKINFQ